MLNIFRMMYVRGIIVIFVVFFFMSASSAQEAGKTQLAQGLGDAQSSASGGNILNPFPGESITETQPMIGVKLPEPTPPLDPNSIKIFIDGTDVTSQTTVSLQYIFYQPEMPLKFGTHNVLITYEQTCKDFSTQASCESGPGCTWNAGTAKCATANPEPPISWSFIIARVAAARPVAPRKPGVRPTPAPTAKSITGRYVIKVKAIDLNEAVREASGYNTPASQYSDIKYQEGVDTTGSYDFTYKFYGKTLIGHVDRSIEQLKGRSNDKFYFRYVDNNDDVTLGDYYMTGNEFSDYSINGVQMRGIKAVRPYKGHIITSFFGRSQEPHDGRLSRSSMGMKVNKKHSETHFFKVIGLRSKQESLPGSYTNPSTDNLMAVVHKLTLNKKLWVDTEVAYDRVSLAGDADDTNSGEDSAFNTAASYGRNPYFFKIGRRTVGTTFNPTVLGTFTEKDREGSYGEFRFGKQSRKFVLSSSYDVYHDNIHHTASNNITDQTRNARNSLSLDYGWILPKVDLTYNKLYTKSKYEIGYPDTQRSESTNASARFTKNFHDTSTFTGTRLTGTFSIYDIDRLSFTGASFDPAQSTVSDYLLRSDTANYNLSTRYKDLITLSYTTSINRAWSVSETTSRTEADSQTNTDSFAMQINIIPFKFITNYNYRRLGRKTFSTDVTKGGILTLSGAPLEYEHTVSMVYYLDQKRKVNLELVRYDREFRAIANAGRAFDEYSCELGYQVEF